MPDQRLEAFENDDSVTDLKTTSMGQQALQQVVSIPNINNPDKANPQQQVINNLNETSSIWQ